MKWMSLNSLIRRSIYVAAALCFALAALFFTTNFNGGDVSAGSTELYVNGPFATGPTTLSGVNAPSGSEWSEVANDTAITANSSSGLSCSVTTTVFRCADDFTVPAGETWSLEQVRIYAYQTGFTGTTAPMNMATLQIWNGVPGDPGSTVVFGDTTTNRLVEGVDVNIWRTFNTLVGSGNNPPSTPGTNRKVWEVRMAADVDLTEGTYWIDWNTRVGTTTAHFAPTVTIPGMRGRPGDNARQFTSTGWGPVLDTGITPTGNPTPPAVPQDFPFKLVGTSSGGSTGAVKNDFDGDGEADFGVVRSVAELTANNEVGSVRGSFLKHGSIDRIGDPGTDKQWWILNSGDNSVTAAGFGAGTANELNVPADFDGDLKADIAVWRSEAGIGSFHIFNSSTSTVSTVEFGIEGDNPTVTGDYDGDGIADPAVFRCPAFPPGGQCHYFYLGSDNNPGNAITFVPWGDNVAADLYPAPGDFDGDGRFDFCLQRPRPGATTQAQFVLLRSSDQAVEYINWGARSAVIAPGDYDGDGRSDLMTVSVVGSTVRWSLLTRSGAQSYTDWGTTSVAGTSEFLAASDYDGDGKMDVAVWRRDNSDPDNSFLYILRSSDGSLEAFEWGSTTDFAVNGWDVN